MDANTLKAIEDICGAAVLCVMFYMLFRSY